MMLVAAFALAGISNAQLTGTKNIPGDYATLASAIADLNTQGVGAGGVVVNLVAGNPQTAPAGGYVIGGTGSLVLTTASNSNPISIVGNGNTITAPTPQATGALNDAIFKLIGADWTTINGFTMLENPANTTTTAASNNMTEWGVALLYVTTTDGARNNTIENNTIDLDRAYQNTFGIYSNSTHSATAVTTSATATGPNGGNDNLKIHGNTITDVNQGIVHVGPIAAADVNNAVDIGGTTPAQGNSITNYGRTSSFSSYANLSTSGTVNGILVRNTRNFNISRNTLASSNGGTTAGFLYGIHIVNSSQAATGSQTHTLSNNTLSLRPASTASGISGISVTGIAPHNTVNSSTTCNMDGNTFHTTGYASGGSGDIQFMNQSGNPLVQTFNNNTFDNISTSNTGSIQFFRHVNSMIAGSSLTISGNAIVGSFTRTGVGSMSVWGSSGTSSANGATHTITGNNFSNISLTGASDFTGFRDHDGTVSAGSTKTISGNTFSNITTGAQTIAPLSVDFSGASTVVSNNTISNITSTITTGTMTMLFLGNSNQPGLVCSGNTISSISIAAPFLTGLQCNAGNAVVTKNRFYDLTTSSSTSSGWVVAIQGSTRPSSTTTISNNLIGDLTAPNSTCPNGLLGMYLTGSSDLSGWNVYYNTINLNASASGAGFGSYGLRAVGSTIATTATLDLRNNIIVNTSVRNGAGLTVAFRRELGGPGTLANYASTSNNNLFYAGVPGASNLVYSEGASTAQSLFEFQSGVFAEGTVSPRDAASVTGAPPFLSTVGTDADFLHIDPVIATLIESGAAPIGGFTDDYDGNLRNGSTPDIGADEFEGTPGCIAPFGTAPVLVNTGCSTYDITVTITNASDSPGGQVHIQVDGSTVTTQGVGGPYNLGTFVNGSTHSVALVHAGDPACIRFLGNTVSSISCNDGDPTTTDVCVNNACENNLTPCDDGDPCTGNDVLVLSNSTEQFDGSAAPALPAGWTTGGTGVANLWFTTTEVSHSAPNSSKVGGVANVSDHHLTSPVLNIASASAQLTFRHRFAFEFFSTTYYDGGVLEISINGGAFTGILAAGGSFVTGGYVGTVSSSFSSPIAGQQAWAANSAGYPAFMTTTVNLPAAVAGQPIRLRWRFGADSDVASTGWWVDDVTITDVICEGVIVDSDNDGEADCEDPCPLLANLEDGDLCDDGDVNTVNDMVQACTCAGTAAAVQVNARAFLEGPYNPATGLMADALRTLGTFPLTDPYPGLGYTHIGSGNAGSVAPVVLAVAGNDAIVDWVVLELRAPAAPATVVASRSVLLQRDGDIVELDGVMPVAFAVAPGSYYAALRQRNHLGVMTASPVALSSVPVLVDLTTSSTATYGTAARKSVPGTFPAEVLWAGDVNFNGELKYTGAGNDRDPILVTVGSTTPNNVVIGAYSTRDVNMNGEVKYTGSSNDRDPILVNVGSTTPNNLRVQQLP